MSNHPSLHREITSPAPELIRGKCSDCGVAAIVAGDGDLKVCPNCHALLWHGVFISAAQRTAEMRKAAEVARRKEESGHD